MKQLLFALFVVGILPNAIAQKDTFQNSEKVKFEWGELFEEKENVSVDNIIGIDNHNIYVLKTKSPKWIPAPAKPYQLARFNKDLTQSKSIKLNLKEGNKKKAYENIFHLNNKLFLLSSFENKKLEKKFLFVQTIDKESLLPNNDIRKIAEVDITEKRKSQKGSFITKFSPDSSKVLIYFDTPDSKDANESYGLHVFDSNFEEHWNKQVTHPYKSEIFELEEPEVANNGDVYVPGVLSEEKNERQSEEENNKYILFEHSNMGQDDFKYEIDFKGIFFDNSKIQVTDKNEIVCAGFYKNNLKQGSSGCFIIKIDRVKKVVKSKHTQEFSLDLIKQGLTEKEKKKVDKGVNNGDDPELFNYEIREIISREDGSLVLLAEQYFMRVETYTSQTGGGGSYYAFNYLDIIAVSISPDGKTEWAVKIPKYQRSVNDFGHFSTFYSYVRNDKIYILYNGNIQNYLNPEDGKLLRMSLSVPSGDAVLVLAEIDSNGKLSREPLIEAGSAGIIIRPKIYKQISDDGVLFFAEYEEEKALVRVIFKN